MVKLTYWMKHSDSATMAHRTKAHFIVSALLSTVEKDEFLPSRIKLVSVNHITKSFKLKNFNSDIVI